MDLIARGGFGNASVREIGATAGMSQAGVVQRFGSKAKLLSAIVEFCGAEWGTEPSATTWSAAPPSVESLIDAYVKPWRADGRRGRLLLMLIYEAKGPSPHVLPAIIDLRRRATRHVQHLVEALQDAETVDDAVDPSGFAIFAIGAFLGVISEQALLPQTESERLYTSFAATLADRLKPAP